MAQAAAFSDQSAAAKHMAIYGKCVAACAESANRRYRPDMVSMWLRVARAHRALAKAEA